MKYGTYYILPLVLALSVCGTNAVQAQVPVLLYHSHASMRITTPEGKVIYIDPYQRVQIGYEAVANIILVTDTRHFDHNHLPSVKNRNRDCVIITPKEAIENNRHKMFDLGYVTIEPVEAGYIKEFVSRVNATIVDSNTAGGIGRRGITAMHLQVAKDKRSSPVDGTDTQLARL
jgi:hypothetical protein